VSGSRQARTRKGAARGARSVLLSIALLACVDNPYVIGRHQSPDGGAPGDECAAAHAQALLCSGFEAEDLAEWPDRTVTLNGELERSTERARSGAASLHATSRGTATTAVVAREFAPVFADELHLRAYVYVPAQLPTETMNLFFLGHEPNPSPPEQFIGLDLNLEDDAVQVFSSQNAPPRLTGTLAIPRERWFCFRARIEVADEGALEVFVDDEIALDVPLYDTLPEQGIHMLRAGIDWSSEQAELFEVFIDDLVLDTAPVTCH
jgi:hypothetical protein